ncbi:AAA family ATPase [Amycolatopsis sp. FBCC-B4732]|uniref:ATP-binding protein n=1 Tax=Amycolatopsis sp. FBCC-B4732 TaxID=3079339 RepID=UPI001FF2B9B6|nr:LuxR family transcriptional regulator [Amycolatopsis sp. FBCC-B4732]UOX91808.1 AAA family ATPase [Amycolatopsis sp. FBCC-B4732]
MTNGIVARAGSPVLVGRTAELAALVSAALRPPAVLVLEGEAGAGKTRLAAELLARPELAGARVLAGRCRPQREPFPYGVVVEALRDAAKYLPSAPAPGPLTGVLGRPLPELAPLLPVAPEPPGDRRAEAHRFFRAVRELLDLLGPLVLVVEDVHWADDGSRRLLRFLMGDLPAGTVLLVSYRPEDVPGGLPLGRAHRPAPGSSTTLVRVGPLDPDGVGQLAAALLGEPGVSGAFAARLHERTAGIPFVVEEAVHALPSPVTDGALDSVEVPELLREATVDRLGSLPLVARRIAEAAAVLAEPAPVELLTTVAGLDAARGRYALVLALERAVLVEAAECRYGFRHDFARQAAYGAIPGPVRQELHRRAVRVLAGRRPEPWLRLAEHSRKAGNAADALRYGEAAADRAMEAGDPATAIGLLRALLAGPELDPSDVDRLAAKLASVAANGVSQAEVVATLEGLLSGDRLSGRLSAEIRLSLGLLLVRQADGLEAARAEIEVALPGLGHRPDLAGRAMAVLAQPWVGATPLRVHLPWLDRVDGLIATAEDARLRLTLMANNIPSRLHIGDPRAWAALDAAPVSAGSAEEQRQLARLYCNAADAGAWTGHHRRARGLLERGMQLAADAGTPYVVSTARTTGVHIDWLSGAWAGLDERARALLAEYRDLLPVSSELSLVLGLLAGARGAWDRAAACFAVTGVDRPENAFTPVVVAAHGGIAGMLLAQDAVEAAAAEAARGLELVRTKGVWAWSGELVPVAVTAFCRTGRAGEARAVLAELDRETRDLAAPMARAVLTEGRGIVAAHDGDVAGAVGAFDEACARYERLSTPYPALVAAERRARCRYEAGDVAAAGEFGDLADAFAALGATRDAARCRHTFRSTGATAPSRRGRRGYGDELSPRERDVARLLTDGHTNREIAEVLFLSRRTVEQHVANVLRKLKVRSRGELVGVRTG